METNPLVFKFIKTADKLNEEHPLYDVSVEDTIAKLGLPYAMAQAYRIAMRKDLTEEEKNMYIDELREHQKSIMAEQEELQRRFIEHMQMQEKIEREKENYPEIVQIEPPKIEGDGVGGYNPE
jgi:hypothetical protein